MRRQKQLESREFIQDKYAEVCAKVQMEWVNVVRPVADDYIEYLVTVAKDDNCSYSCMNQQCL